ncbi:hypothetical protein VTN02DRAFT_2445 [Thermoascus thermophilus]
MVALIPPPDPRTLLPPFLACLPTAFVATRPPPALLPLLSPILRQRVQIFSSTAASPADSWLRLLSWDAGNAERVQSRVDGARFELHPVSGEVDLPGDIPVTYKRIDAETLRAKVPLPDHGLTVLYLWCPNDPDGGGPGWRVAELLPHDGPAADEASWSSSIGEANERAQGRLKEAEQGSYEAPRADDSDDDDYWAQYDNSPGRTPSIKTPAPHATVASIRHPLLSDASYFDRYADVQPALDHDDPSEDKAQMGQSSLHGNALAQLLRRQIRSVDADEPPRINGYPAGDARGDVATPLTHPRPSSTPSAGSDALVRLEQEAESQSATEMGVKQHISASIKSLFRLAKSTGMPRAEFESIVQTELEVLGLADDE